MKKIILFIALLLPATIYATPLDKIVSLDLCSDWMLVKFAEKSQVLALSSFVRHYPVDWIGEDWPIHDGQLESILALQPNLVITGEFNAILLRERLKALGIKVEILILPRSLSDIEKYEKQFFNAVGLAESLVSKPLPEVVVHEKSKKLLLLGANGIGTGKNTLEDDVLSYAGWENYLSDSGYVNLDLEALVVNPPDAILWSAPNSEAMANKFAEHPAIKKAIPQEKWLTTTYWNWQCPGPWTWDLVKQLTQ